MERTADDLELRHLTPALRAFTVAVWIGSAALFTGLAIRYPTGHHEVGFVIGALCAWAALYWLRVPALRAIVRGNGVSYVDGRLGALLVFRWHHAAWTDIVAVDTRVVIARYGNYVRTRVTVRTDEGGTRRFTVTSHDTHYGPFIDALAAHTYGMPIETSGLGVEVAGVRQAIHRIRAARVRLVGAFALAAVLLAVVAFVTRR